MSSQSQSLTRLRISILLLFYTTLFVSNGTAFALEPPPVTKAGSSAVTTPAVGEVSLDEKKALEGIDHAVIPFEYDPPSKYLMTVQARVNGSKPMNFLLDTGWGLTFFVLPWAAKELDLKLTGKEERLNPGNQRIQLAGGCLLELLPESSSKSAKITIDNTYVDDVPTLEKLSSSRIAGIIGDEFFTAFTTRFDFDRKTLTLITAKHPPLSFRPNSVTVPLEKTESTMPHIRATPEGGSPVTFLVDTGSNANQIPADIASKLPRIATSRSMTTDIATTVTVDDILLPRMTVGTRDVPLVSMTAKPGLRQSILGMDFLSRFRVTLDKPNGVMTLEPRPSYKWRLEGYTGLWLEKRKYSFYISQVFPIIPEIREVRVGDRLVSVDGQSVDGLALLEASLKLGGYEGTPITLVVEKPDGKQVNVKALRRTNYDAVMRSRLGLLLIKDEDQFARILQVDAGSEAERLGMTENQFVTRINNKSTRAMSPQSLFTELKTATGNTVKVEKKTIEVK